MKKYTIIPVLFMISAFFLMAGSIENIRFPIYTAAACTESIAALDNPYTGWYQIYAYALSDGGGFDPGLPPELEYGPGLIMLQFNLCNYAQSPVSSAALQQLDGVLDAWSAMGKQLIVRFLYDWSGEDAMEKEPEDLSLVLEHMSQTAEILNRYANNVYIVQGIFVGAWGEMHDSNYMDEESMLTLINHLADVTDPGIFLAVRTPEQWRTIARSSQPLSKEQAFGGSLPARLSLFNDGMLGSYTDMNTYGELDTAFSHYGFEKRTRQAELFFQHRLCRFVPNGGEVIVANPYNDFPAAVQDLSYTHVSYLNNRYDAAVLDKWRQDIYQGDGPFHGMNGYDYIACHLGYRYVVRSSEFSRAASSEEADALSIFLENVGFSNSCSAFDVSLTLKKAGGGQEYIFPVETDTRFWAPGTLITLEIPLNVYELSTGDYEIYLKITDPASGFPIRLANEDEMEDGSLFIGALSLSKLSQWNLIAGSLVGKA